MDPPVDTPREMWSSRTAAAQAEPPEEPPQDLEEEALPQDYSVTLPFSAHYSPDETAIFYSDALPPVNLPPARRPPESRK